MPLVQRDDMLVTDAHGPQSACKDGTVGMVSIADQIARSLIQGNASVIWRAIHSAVGFDVDVDPNKVSAFQPDDDEGIHGTNPEWNELYDQLIWSD